MVRNDGLDSLSDRDLRDLAIEYGIETPNLVDGVSLPVGGRERILAQLRQQHASAPGTGANLELIEGGGEGGPPGIDWRAGQAPPEDPSPEREFHSTYAPDDDAEYLEIQEIVDAHWEDYSRQNPYRPDSPASPLDQWLVTLSSGNSIVVIALPEAMAEVAAPDPDGLGLHVSRLSDDTPVSVVDDLPYPASSTRYSETELGAMPQRTPGENLGDTSAVTPQRGRRPRLPRRRLGKHQQGEVSSMDAQRLKPPKGQPTLPFGYESKQPVEKLPRHRRRDK